ncbi:uncharacterized protein LOC127122756 [Lathyrus oleraceus]|nr:uncharacterized protein LOC127122756 [Pisum sativum]
MFINLQHQTQRDSTDDDEIVCLGASFFMNDNYQLTGFTFGSQHIRLFCLHSASTVIESGSGIGITGILCRKFCNRVVSTDYNEEVLKIINKNIELHLCPEDVSPTSHGLVAEKLEWGNTDQV